jgi:hypothetical protein
MNVQPFLEVIDAWVGADVARGLTPRKTDWMRTEFRRQGWSTKQQPSKGWMQVRDRTSAAWRVTSAVIRAEHRCGWLKWGSQ